ncbi:putative leucine-rich repeat-containing protein DDB_G0290503 isoform X15 [Acanthochromis polyacanthus]|uniref:putative leucine-rich repeat-containing protein DDB_G0290503 isoform X13 n=1 Tax=Acanthochromis polyacanthus TaxID=80966 RepID=UPI00223402A4|nr:putative leucine-rich repeat-containing protein DDB_G0290503 isoform X13 [Acanthochromis polyacanthus]XP_051814735.1 putative leucine-rich repeat-containing protein DDB_G0290503 isoform X14 [Acanthochromis polyacanthus]XP_051814736.1 putative leucine-rich repeat-containing protein DDB_G0290503 isoform X15 [Acanthochromis polyacanthus]
MDNEFRQTRYDLKCKGEEVKSHLLRMKQMEEDLHQTRCDLKHGEDEVEKLIWGISKMEQRQHPSMGEMKGHLYSIRSDLTLKEDQVEKLIWSMREMEGHFDCMRCDLKHGEDEVEKLIWGSAVKHGEEMELFSHRMVHMEGQLYSIRSDLERKEKELESLSHSMREMEGQLYSIRSDLEEKEKELKSFKDRVAGDVALSMKTGKTFVSLNSPVSRDRLKEMYEELWMEWRKIKNHLKSNGENPESVKEMIQEKFKEAMVAMEKKKKQIDEVFGVNELSRGSASEKVQQYRQSTCQNLQLVLYHGRKEDADLKTPSSPHESEKPQDVMKSWSSKCYWMGCLMALNNPPLHPDWKNHRRSMDPWDFFPRNLTAASGK